MIGRSIGRRVVPRAAVRAHARATVRYGPLFERTANPNKKTAWIADCELIGSPWLHMRCTFLNDELANAVGHGVDIIDIEI